MPLTLRFNSEGDGWARELSTVAVDNAGDGGAILRSFSKLPEHAHAFHPPYRVVVRVCRCGRC